MKVQLSDKEREFMKSAFIFCARLLIFSLASFILVLVGEFVLSVNKDLFNAYIAVIAGLLVTIGYTLSEG